MYIIVKNRPTARNQLCVAKRAHMYEELDKDTDNNQIIVNLTQYTDKYIIKGV